MKKELQELLAAGSHLYVQSCRPSNGLAGSDAPASFGTIAGKLGCKTAPDLIVAAAAHLTFVARKAEFSRKELLNQVKGTSGYYKTSMGKNFTNYLNNRLKAGELVEPRARYLALSSKKHAESLKNLLTQKELSNTDKLLLRRLMTSRIDSPKFSSLNFTWHR